MSSSSSGGGPAMEMISHSTIFEVVMALIMIVQFTVMIIGNLIMTFLQLS